ncbi:MULTISPECIES: hypothetical protein [unclassified Streptomyces]|uniref:Uncharacterized protein n=1 Tax=Streptomyces sp. NBC_00060 TaxID=2975636 RepID=A0AAU2HBE3_9ACTN
MSSAQEFSPMARSRQVRDRSVDVAPSKSPLPLRRTPLTRCRVIDLMRVGRTLCC